MKNLTNTITEKTDQIVEILDLIGFEDLADQVTNEFFKFVQSPATNTALENLLNNIIDNNRYILDMLNN